MSEFPRPRKLFRGGGLLLAAVLAAGFVAAAGSPGTASAHGDEKPVAVDADGLRALPAITPIIDCGAVTRLDLTGVTDAPVTLKTATLVTTGTPAPYCQVTGTIAPADTIVLRLPTRGWTQRYLQTGCGGECGSANIGYTQATGCTPVTNGQIASATTDMGHQGQNDGSWAANNPQAVIDFAYRAEHVTAQTAKAIITKFYGKRPAYSYFDGCSDGGREALMEAQRYPGDFNGIAAGAPAQDMDVQNIFHHAWNVLTNLDSSGKYILLADKLPLLHDAVLAACDGIDGLKDGQITDPRVCHFNPYSLVCKAGQAASTCLTTAEAGVVWRLHNGAVTADGKRLEPAISHEWGSELDWTLFIPSAQGQHVGSEQFVLAYARYLGYPNFVDADWQLADLKLTVAGFWQAMQSSSYLSAMDPDLSRFQRDGGKLVLWHGWSDQHISPQGTIEYYDAVRKTLGDKVTDSFAKFFLFPGVAHCGGGTGPNVFDVLTPVMAWTESGRTPTKIVASLTGSTGAVTRTRPVYPFPAVARYDGTGSIDNASNFVSYTPRHPVQDDFNWLGARLFSSDYQVHAKAVGTKLVLKPSTTWLTRKAG
jgi:feruloyl esterase